MKKQIEIAKSWFILSQIFIILAGFLFASAGITITNAQNTLNFGINLASQFSDQSCKEIENASFRLCDSLGYISNMVDSSLKIYKSFFKVGGILVLFSIFSWWYGQHLLYNIKE